MTSPETSFEDVVIEGEGTQTAFGNTVSGDLVMKQITFVRGRPKMVLSEGAIGDRIAEYVPAVNHDEIVAALRQDRVIALAGSPGFGVTTTGIAALRQLHPKMPIRLFSTGEDDVEEIGATEAMGYLVRAGDEEESRLRACLEAVLASQGLLLVVGTAVEHRRFTGFLSPIPVQPPPAEAVYHRRLLHHQLGDTPWPSWPRAAELLKDATPGDARRLADIVIAVCRDGGDVEEVERAYRGWTKELREWFSEHPELRDRTLMVAASTIAPADETSVYGAALSLSRQLKIDPAGGGLAWRPSTGLTELLGADSREGRIEFPRHGFAPSVLRNVWTDYPLARQDLLSWLSTLPTDEVVSLEPAFRIKIAETFADLAAEHEAVEKIVQVAEQWADGSRRDADLAYTALARTCLHPLVGGRVRRRLYEWSRRERPASQTLRLTIVRVCEVLGQTHVSIALTRLKHLATLGNTQIQDEVFEVLRALAQIHPEAVVNSVLEWCRGAEDLRDQNAANRLYVGLRFLLADVLADASGAVAPASGPTASLHRLIKVMEQAATRDNESIRILVLASARGLAEHFAPAVLQAALTWANGTTVGPPAWSPMPDRMVSLTKLGTELFLGLAIEQDPQGYAEILTGVAALDPRTSVPAWRVALNEVSARWNDYDAQRRDPHGRYVPRRYTGGRYEDFEDAVWHWLDTAVARPDLRQGIVAAFAAAAGRVPARRREMMELVRFWADRHPGRRAVKDAILVRLLLPEWQRLLLMFWVGLKTTIIEGP
ncbi:MAG TPA: hypothetical protein VFU43_02535 [Streptosporangiaceae bacterium]|nr:hypothetical protein [Streptosporangiaceae bacterium]